MQGTGDNTACYLFIAPMLLCILGTYVTAMFLTNIQPKKKDNVFQSVSSFSSCLRQTVTFEKFWIQKQRDDGSRLQQKGTIWSLEGSSVVDLGHHVWWTKWLLFLHARLKNLTPLDQLKQFSNFVTWRPTPSPVNCKKKKFRVIRLRFSEYNSTLLYYMSSQFDAARNVG